jgi:RNA recognition motif-containing protein
VAIVQDSDDEESENDQQSESDERAPRQEHKQQAEQMNPEDEGKTELFVRNISRNVREEGLRKFFGEFGPLTKCKYFFGKQVAFIEYGTP